MSCYDNKKNRTTPSTSTCQVSDHYSNITQCYIHIGNFFCYVIITYLHRNILFIITSISNLILQSTYIYDAILCVYYADKNHTPSNTTQDHQFVSHDLSYSTDDDLNMTQENIAIGNHPLFIFCFFHHQIN